VEPETRVVKILPMGATPRRFWDEVHPSPTVEQTKERAMALAAAIARYVETGYAYHVDPCANWTPRGSVNEWIVELIERHNSVPQSEVW
jgi:hypothetical protein